MKIPVGIIIFHKVLFVSSGPIPVFGSCGAGVGTGVDTIVIIGVGDGVVDAGVEIGVGAGVIIGVGDAVGTGVGTGVEEGVGAGVGAGVGGTAHVALVMVFVSNVTAPFRANIRPSTFAPVVRVADANARIFPLKVEFAPSVAELPTCQKILQAWAPFVRTILLAPAVISVEAVLKMKTADASPCASRVRVPVIPNVPLAES